MLKIQQSTLSPNSVMLTFQLDLAGVLRGDPVAIDKAHAELERLPSRSPAHYAVRQGSAMPDLVQTDVDGGFCRLVSESIGLTGTTPIVDVQFHRFLDVGCQPADATPVTPCIDARAHHLDGKVRSDFDARPHTT